jgi:PAT family beta-lactamase induction signal transducer AmpG
LANAVTGFIVEETGWVLFFLLCTLLAIPGMVTLIWVAPWRAEAEPVEQASPEKLK